MAEYEEQPPAPVQPMPPGKANEWATVIGGVFGGGTLLAFIISRIWKWWTEQKTVDSAGSVIVSANDATTQIIQRQETRILSLETRITSLEMKLEEEVTARRQAQDELVKHRVRISQLESILNSHSIPLPPHL